jgi:para-nitrobenzyl esterase
MHAGLWRMARAAPARSSHLARCALPVALIPGLALLVLGCGGGSDNTSTAPPAATAYNVEADTVKTVAGTVRATSDSTAALRIFKAIPYAAAPIGALRWQAPQPPISWTGTRKSDVFSAACMQNVSTTLTSILYNGSYSISENCLYLNVWTPAAASTDKRPVMVLIQGGSNTGGSASNPLYDGAGLARKGVVVVTFNYRLGVLGWLAHPELSAESPNKVSGNYGLLDQIAALQWVQANITGFGGDPGNVTVYSQSAGAQDANTLMASPLAKGLIHRAVLESGGTIPGIRGNARTLAQAEQGGVAFAATAKAADLAALRAMEAADLQVLSNTYPAAEIVDGYVLPDQIDKIFRAGQALDIPVLAGSNSDDQTVFPPGFATTLAAFQATSSALFGASAGQVQSFYNVTDDASAAAVRFIMPEDFQSSWQPYTLARTMTAKYKAKAYLYLFNRVPPYYPDQVNYAEAADPTTLGAYHTLEQPYFYSNLEAWPRPYTATDVLLSDITSTYLVNFATSGDPNAPLTTTAAGNALPQWPVFANTGGQLMMLGDAIAPAAEPHQAALDLFDSVFAQTLGRPLSFQ